jgi:hypothetical protein
MCNELEMVWEDVSIQASAWRNWGKPQKTSVGWASVLTKMWTGPLLNTSQYQYYLNQPAQSFTYYKPSGFYGNLETIMFPFKRDNTTMQWTVLPRFWRTWLPQSNVTNAQFHPDIYNCELWHVREFCVVTDGHERNLEKWPNTWSSYHKS